MDSTKGTARRRTRILLLGLGSVFGVFLLVVGGGAAYYTTVARGALDSVARSDLLPADSEQSTPATSGPLNIVLMGSDSRSQKDGGRSDVLILLHLPATRDAAYLVSFPRDMWVNIPGHGKGKINAAYAKGGAPLTVKTLQELLDVKADHAALIDFDGFIQLIDLVGGVTVVNNIDGGTFRKGEIHLDGKSALSYTRERHGLPNGDLDRSRRQRQVLVAFAKELVKDGKLADPALFTELSQKVAPLVTLDKGFSTDALSGLALSMRPETASNIGSLMAPISGFGRSNDGQSYDIVNQDGVAELGAAIRNDQMAAYYTQHKDDPLITGR